MKYRLLSVSLLAAFVGFNLAARAVEIGASAPALQISEWIKGTSVDIAAARSNRVVVVEFWGTYCPPCLVSIPHLTELQKKYKDTVSIVGISNEDPDTVKKFVTRMGAKMDYTVALDKQAQTLTNYMSEYGNRSPIPWAYIVDKQGVVAWSGPPFTGFDEALAEIVSGKFDLAKEKQRQTAIAGLRKTFYDYLGAVSAPDVNKKTVADLARKLETTKVSIPPMLRSFAWLMLTDNTIKYRDVPLALKLAKNAIDGSDTPEPQTMHVYAKALFLSGKTAEAVEWEKKAVAGAVDEPSTREFQTALESYQKAPK